MLPTVNGKKLLDCVEEDLKALLNNPDYRENQYIDYKQNFAFLECEKGNEKQKKIDEFRNDVCAFANSEGGYLIYGISDDNGCASELVGIDIPNDDTDKFELDRRNNLTMISPRVPYLCFHFVLLENNKYIVIIYVRHDNMAPYVHVVDNNSYKIYKRSGNQKAVMMYQEIKNMFTQSISLDKEISSYRKERIEHYNNSRKDEKYILVHIIPETFLDSSGNTNMYIFQKKYGKNLGNVFQEWGCGTYSLPCVDGIRFISNVKLQDYSEGYAYNNRIIEGYSAIHINSIEKFPNGYLPSGVIWRMINGLFTNFKLVFSELLQGVRLFFCISIVGCEGVVTEDDFFSNYQGVIDRNNLICQPICIEDISKEDVEIIKKKIYIEFMLAIGITHDEYLSKFIGEVYDF